MLELLLTWAMLVHEITVAQMDWDTTQPPDDPGCPDTDIFASTFLWREDL